MKKFLLAAIVTGISAVAFAQTTFDFETWTGNEPQGWISENELMLAGNPQSCFEETNAADVHGGLKAMRLLSVTMSFPVAGLPNPIGLAAPGKLVSFQPKFGMAYTGRPASVDFWYKYTPVANDTAEFLVALWNTATGDTLGFGYWKTGTASTSYASQSVSILYNPAFANQFPDTMGLTFSSTKLFNPNYTFCPNCGKAGSTLWVDDITFSGWNGINEQMGNEGVTLFPNPASDFVSISVEGLQEAFAVNAYDVTGRLAGTASFSGNGTNTKSGQVITSGLSAGVYSYTIVDSKGAVLRAGKFNILR